jgi:hypothetical protein
MPEFTAEGAENAEKKNHINNRNKKPTFHCSGKATPKQTAGIASWDIHFSSSAFCIKISAFSARSAVNKPL